MNADDHPGPADAADPDLASLIESDPQWSGLVPVVHRLRSAATIESGDAWVRQQASAAAMVAVHTSEVVPLPTSGRRVRYVRAAAIAAAVTLAAGAGLAAADTLPRPLQHVVSQVAGNIGIDIADPDDPAPPPVGVVTPPPITAAATPPGSTVVPVPDSQVGGTVGQSNSPDPSGQPGQPGPSTQSGPDDPSRRAPSPESPEADPKEPRKEGPAAAPTTQAEPPSPAAEPKSSDDKPKVEPDRSPPASPTTKKGD